MMAILRRLTRRTRTTFYVVDSDPVATLHRIALNALPEA